VPPCSYADLPQLAEETLHLPTSSIAHAVLDYKSGAVSGTTTSGGADVLELHQAAAQKVVSQAFAPVLAHMGETTAQVENGAPTSQPLGGYFSDARKGMGAITLPAVQAPRTDCSESQVIWNTAASGGGSPPPLADMLAQMLETHLVSQPVPSSQAQVVVILGSQFPKVQP
jgi:hypothetical protein